MKNILMIYESEIPSAKYMEKCFSLFSKKYNCIFSNKHCLSVTKKDILKADILIAIRPDCPLMCSYLKLAKQCDKIPISFFDDDLKDVPSDILHFPLRKNWVLKCLKESNIVLTTNQLIADEYKNYTFLHRFAILNLAVDEHEIFYTQKKTNNVKIIYAASTSHVKFYNEYIKDNIPRLIEKYNELLEFWFIGVDPGMENSKYINQIHTVPYMSFDEYNNYMRNNYFDIGLSPLLSNHFTEKKYYNKFVEYTKNGICGVYSKCMPYMLVVEDGINGFLADNNLESWFNKLCYVIENPEKRTLCIRNAQHLLLNEYSQDVVFSTLVKDIPELTNYDSGFKACNMNLILHIARYIGFRISELIYLTVESLKRFGVRATINKIKIKLNRRIT